MKHNHQLFIDIAERVAKESTATRLQVGAVVAKDGSIIEIGYNGTPPGWHTNECEYLEEGFTVPRTKPEVIHGEMNALLKCAKLGKPTNGAILYVTHAPCHNCAISILASGISEVYYVNKYRDELGLDILKEGKVKVTQWDTNITQQ